MPARNRGHDELARAVVSAAASEAWGVGKSAGLWLDSGDRSLLATPAAQPSRSARHGAVCGHDFLVACQRGLSRDTTVLAVHHRYFHGRTGRHRPLARTGPGCPGRGAGRRDGIRLLLTSGASEGALGNHHPIRKKVVTHMYTSTSLAGSTVVAGSSLALTGTNLVWLPLTAFAVLAAGLAIL